MPAGACCEVLPSNRDHFSAREERTIARPHRARAAARYHAF